MKFTIGYYDKSNPNYIKELCDFLKQCNPDGINKAQLTSIVYELLKKELIDDEHINLALIMHYMFHFNLFDRNFVIGNIYDIFYAERMFIKLKPSINKLYCLTDLHIHGSKSNLHNLIDPHTLFLADAGSLSIVDKSSEFVQAIVVCMNANWWRLDDTTTMIIYNMLTINNKYAYDSHYLLNFISPCTEHRSLPMITDKDIKDYKSLLLV